MMFAKLSLFTFICILISVQTYAQSGWTRKETKEPPLQLFSSTEVFDLPTAETLQKGDIYFLISHKFTTPVSEGINELFGFDGPVIMRLSLGYAISDDMLVKLGRSNHLGNYDLNLKYKALEIKNENAPILVALNVGMAYNSKANPEPINNNRLFQYFGSVIFNTLIDKKL